MENKNHLSQQLDEAKANEEYHRQQLLFWKERRQRLERLIPDFILELRKHLGADDERRN